MKKNVNTEWNRIFFVLVRMAKHFFVSRKIYLYIVSYEYKQSKHSIISSTSKTIQVEQNGRKMFFVSYFYASIEARILFSLEKK